MVKSFFSATVLAVMLLTTKSAADHDEEGLTRFRRHHHHGARGGAPHNQPSPPAPPGPGPTPPAPGPPPPRPPCDCNACDYRHCRIEPDPPYLPEPPVGAGGTTTRGSPATTPPMTPAPTPRFGGGFIPGPGRGTPSSPLECVTALAGLMTCGGFLTGGEPDTPSPQSECCTGLGGFLNAVSSSPPGDGDRTLRCLCPVVLGEVNRMLSKPIDPVKLMYLPIACGVVLPPRLLYVCFTSGGQHGTAPGLVPNSWGNRDPATPPSTNSSSSEASNLSP